MKHKWDYLATLYLFKVNDKCFNIEAAYTLHKSGCLMLMVLTEDIAEEKTNPCIDQHHPTYHRRPQTIQAIWIHTSRHIVNSDNEDRDRTIWTGKGSLGHWHTCYSLTVLLTFQWKSLLDVSRTNYGLRFTTWNLIVGLLFLSLLVKFTLLVEFFAEAVWVKLCTQLDRGLWITETDKTVIVWCPVGFKFFTSCMLHCS